MRKRASDLPDETSPEWTVEDFRRARPLLEVVPKEVADALHRMRGQRGPQKNPTKELISLRLDRDVVMALRATGEGWQTRANDALRAAYVTGPVPSGTRKTAARRKTVTKRRSSAAKRRA